MGTLEDQKDGLDHPSECGIIYTGEMKTMTPSEYKNWILSQDSTCSVSEKGSDTVILSTDYAE